MRERERETQKQKERDRQTEREISVCERGRECVRVYFLPVELPTHKTTTHTHTLNCQGGKKKRLGGQSSFEKKLKNTKLEA